MSMVQVDCATRIYRAVKYRTSTKVLTGPLPRTVGFARAISIQFVLGLMAALVGVNAMAGVNTWTSIGPEGGQINKVAYNKTNPAIVYATTAGGFYRSTNAGASWQLVKSDFSNSPSNMVVDPANGNNVYVVAAGEGVFASSDAGASLTALSLLPSAIASINQIEISADGSTLYVAAGTRIFRSTDAGHSWQERTPIPATIPWLTSLIVHPSNADTLYAISYSKNGYVSTDGGSSWQTFNLPPSVATGTLTISLSDSPTFWATTPDGVWRSKDGGAQWMLVSSAGATSTIAVDPINPLNVYAWFYPTGLYRSSDEGSHWVSVATNVRTISTMTIDSVTGKNLMLGGAAGLWGSADSGTTWQPRNAGLVAQTVSSLSASKGSDRIYMNTYAGSIHYVQGGASFTAEVNNEALRQTSPSTSAFDSSSVLAQSLNPDRLFVSTSHGLIRSEDAGNSWTLLSQAPFAVNSLADSPFDRQVILASMNVGTSSGTFRTMDGGDHWAVVAGLPTQTFTSALIMSNSSSLAYAGVQAVDDSGVLIGYGVYRSTDNGLTWTAVNAGIASSLVSGIVIDPSNDQTVYAGTNTALMKSTNSGTSWSSLSWGGSPGDTGAQALAIDPAHSKIIYAARVGHIARSIDAGATWEDLLTISKPIWNPRAMLVDPQRTNTLLFAGDGLGVQQLIIEPDLALDVSAPSGAISTGSVATYKYTARNLGPYHATGVYVSILLPSSAGSVSATTPAGTCATTNATVTCSLGNMLVGSSALITVSSTQPSAGTFHILGSIAGDQTDGQSANNATDTSLTVAEPVVASSSGGGGGMSLWFLLAMLPLRLFGYRSRQVLVMELSDIQSPARQRH